MHELRRLIKQGYRKTGNWMGIEVDSHVAQGRNQQWDISVANRRKGDKVYRA
jgi:hypothetical protein